MRSMLSQNVEEHEQGEFIKQWVRCGSEGRFTYLPSIAGKLFGLFAVIDDISALCGALVFNSLYPITRVHLFNGIMFLGSALVLLIPTTLLSQLVPKNDVLAFINNDSVS